MGHTSGVLPVTVVLVPASSPLLALRRPPSPRAARWFMSRDDHKGTQEDAARMTSWDADSEESCDWGDSSEESSQSEDDDLTGGCDKE